MTEQQQADGKVRIRRLIRSIPGGTIFLKIRWRLLVLLDGTKTRILRGLLPNYRRQRGDFQEINHWSKILSSKEAIKRDADYSKRADPDRLLQAELAALLPVGNRSPTVLDVGSGPLSTVGIVHGDARVVLTGADPLAEDYLGRLAAIEVAPNCRLVACNGEQLAATFGADAFDLVTCVNAMDHSEDPVEVFRQMVQVTKPGGHLYLYHAENEGFHERYHGMHQWNFRNKGGSPVLNDGRKSYRLLEGNPNVSLVSNSRLPKGDRHALEWVFRKA
jgi:SAM-dependent methyltransferase